MTHRGPFQPYHSVILWYCKIKVESMVLERWKTWWYCHVPSHQFLCSLYPELQFNIMFSSLPSRPKSAGENWGLSEVLCMKNFRTGGWISPSRSYSSYGCYYSYFQDSVYCCCFYLITYWACKVWYVACRMFDFI